MSSFRRATPSGVSAANGAVAFAPAASTVKRGLPGTKPFLNGQTLVSTGLAQLDSIIGGGWMLGTLVLLDVPRNDAAAASATLVDDFHRYFLAEGVVAGQCAVVVSDDATAFVKEQLPLELSTAQKQVKSQLAEVNLSGAKPTSDNDAGGEQLTIAWQYQKYIADATSGAATLRFCHSFDLSRSMHPELLSANPPIGIELSRLADAASSISDVYASLFSSIEREIQARNGGQVIRVCIRELGSPVLGPPDHDHMIALYGFLRRLRSLAAGFGRTVVFQLSGHLYSFPTEFANELRHLSDYVFEVKSFVGENDMLPGELLEFHGLLDIKKLARVHTLTCHSMDTVKFGIKRERRKMKIEKFHLPPEGSRSSNDKDKKKSPASATTKSNLVSSSFVRKSTSSVGCNAGVSNSGLDPLDF